jgi:rfaE bifunctional protein kinase chain/domain/rfaE bifunctional protein nucleotidyltransferase chain/domain
LQQYYQHKIKTIDELRTIVGPRPRTKKVVQCHGTFDIVHPGHIRHLLYAKTLGDILVVSLTCDAHITKSDYRPFVPQQLRAMNLAALEVVDYVLIDNNPTPLENIALLQPDFFAKGYEYQNGGIAHKTREEIEVLNSYGGEIIFTPGDVVFSSSKFIETTPPNISSEKLVTLMNSEGVTFESLKRSLDQVGGIRIHVVGDTIVDSYNYCSLIGSSTTKTPTLSVKLDREVDFAGGAAIVCRHLRAAEAQVRFSTVLGDDALGKFVLAEMAKYGIECNSVTEPIRVTTQKKAFIANGHRLLKVDQVDNRPIQDRTLERLVESLSSSKVDGVVFSDFRHGIFNRSTVPLLAEAIPQGAIRVADSQVASRWGNILDFQGFDLITPNEREARFALGDQDSVVRPLCLQLYQKARCKYLILKMGDKGIMTYRAPSHDVRSFFSVDSFATNVVDPIGAGDALLAYATLGLIATGSEVIASVLGTMAAAVACEHEGNQPVAPEAVRQKLTTIEQRVRYA